MRARWAAFVRKAEAILYLISLVLQAMDSGYGSLCVHCECASHAILRGKHNRKSSQQAHLISCSLRCSWPDVRFDWQEGEQRLRW